MRALIFCLMTSLLLGEDPRVQDCFQACFQNPPEIIPLKGGYTSAQIFLLEDKGEKYVLRLQEERNSSSLQREFFSAQEAAKVGVAPKIFWASSDKSAFLMQYVEGSHLSIPQAKKAERIASIAKDLRKIHSLPKNPIHRSRYFERVEKLYKLLEADNLVTKKMKQALEEARAVYKGLQELQIPLVTIHGDMNLHNIFITEKGCIFIDWSETNQEDPFYDLSCFSLLSDYGSEEEKILLESYLDRLITDADLKHYQAVKKINLFCFSVNCLDMATHEKDGAHLKEAPLADWSFYIHEFAEKNEGLTPQFFYDWSRSSLEKFIH